MWIKCVCGNEGIFYQTLFKLKHIQVRLISRDFNLRWIQICSWLNDDSCSSGVKDSNQFKPVKYKKFHEGLILIIIFQILVLWPLCDSLCSCQTHRQTQRRLRLKLEVELLLPAKRVKTKWWRIKRTENKTTGSLYLYKVALTWHLTHWHWIFWHKQFQTNLWENVTSLKSHCFVFYDENWHLYIYHSPAIFVNEKYEKYVKMWNLKWVTLQSCFFHISTAVNFDMNLQSHTVSNIKWSHHWFSLDCCEWTDKI